MNRHEDDAAVAKLDQETSNIDNFNVHYLIKCTAQKVEVNPVEPGQDHEVLVQHPRQLHSML